MADKKPLVLVNGDIEGINAADAIALIHGGTGSNTAAGARVSLGLQIGTNVQASSDELTALAGLSTTGIPLRTAAGAYVTRAVTGTANQVAVANGDGVSGNPTVSLATLADAGGGAFSKFIRDTFGRVSGSTPVVSADIRGLVDSAYVTKDSNSTLANGIVLSYNSATTSFATTDLVPKSYVDNLLSGGLSKPAVRLLSATNVTISSPTAGPFDGVSPATGDRILLIGQTAAEQNGSWVYNGSAVPLTRPADFDTSVKASPGSSFFVSEGTSFGNNTYTLITDAPIVLGTTLLTFTQTSGAGQVVAGNGLIKTGNTLDVVSANAARILVNANDIDLATTSVAPGTYTKITVDAYGRATTGATATPADVGAQASSAELTALSALSTNGQIVRTGAGAYSARTLIVPAAGISVTNGDGVAGNPTISLSNDLSALENLAGTGFAVRTNTDSWVIRSFAVTTRLTIADAAGVAGNPTIDLATSGVTPGTYNTVNVDAFGRVISASNTIPNGDNTKSLLINANGTAINICNVVYSDAAGCKLALANTNLTRRAIGLVADASINNSATGNFVTSGLFTASTAQWDAATGQTGGLTPNTDYYVSATVAGRLTTVAPSTTGQWVQPVGVALNSTQLTVNITRAVRV